MNDSKWREALDEMTKDRDLWKAKANKAQRQFDELLSAVSDFADIIIAKFSKTS